jgi:hypothetical protein
VKLSLCKTRRHIADRFVAHLALNPGNRWKKNVSFRHSFKFEYNQQAAKLYNILYAVNTCFRRFLRPSSGAQTCTHSIGYMSSLLAATASVGELHWQQSRILYNVAFCWLYLKEYINDARSHEHQISFRLRPLYVRGEEPLAPPD